MVTTRDGESPQQRAVFVQQHNRNRTKRQLDYLAEQEARANFFPPGPEKGARGESST